MPGLPNQFQTDLFGAPARAPGALPDGFRTWPNILPRDVEADLARRLAALPLVPYEFRGYAAHRRVASFGCGYDRSTRAIAPAQPIPDYLMELRARAAAAAGLPADRFVQALVNEYRPGAGIGWHRDRPPWGIILGVSLLASCSLRLRRPSGAGWERANAALPPGSAYLLSGEARLNWEHSIAPMAALRISVTFRTVA